MDREIHQLAQFMKLKLSQLAKEKAALSKNNTRASVIVDDRPIDEEEAILEHDLQDVGFGGESWKEGRSDSDKETSDEEDERVLFRTREEDSNLISLICRKCLANNGTVLEKGKRALQEFICWSCGSKNYPGVVKKKQVCDNDQKRQQQQQQQQEVPTITTTPPSPGAKACDRDLQQQEQEPEEEEEAAEAIPEGRRGDEDGSDQDRSDRPPKKPSFNLLSRRKIDAKADRIASKLQIPSYSS